MATRQHAMAPIQANTTKPRRQRSEIQRQSVSYIVRSAFAGGIAGCAAKTLVAPLDRVKILFQTGNPEFRVYSSHVFGLSQAISSIWRDDGLLGLFRGHSVTLFRVFPYAAIKFVAYEQIRGVVIRNERQETPVRRFVSGSMAGVCSVFFTYPLDVLRVQLAYNTSKSYNGSLLLNTVRSIAKQRPGVLGGLTNFYSGYLPTLVGVVPYAGVSFVVHDHCHDIMRSRLLRRWAINYDLPAGSNGKHPLKVWAELVAGGVSGLLAQTASYPLEIIRRRMQVAGISHHHLTVRQTVRQVFRENGFRGFFVGLSIGYIKVVPMFACSFFVYEKIKYLVGI